MKYKDDILSSGLLVMLAVMVIGLLIIFVFEKGKESARTEILEQCQKGKPVTIDGIKIHCGVIHKNVNQEAAKYRGVKQCVKLIGAWNDEQR
jgi:hypothetical protein